jgi:hypothetical protein
MARTARSTPKKSAADAYGWTYEHIQALRGDAEATGALSGFLNHMQGGRLYKENMKELNVVRVNPYGKERTGRSTRAPLGLLLKLWPLGDP